jgi:hypothetical protein
LKIAIVVKWDLENKIERKILLKYKGNKGIKHALERNAKE